ncbi:RecB family exonuclease [Actinomyces sp. oral taxon 180 str. F0310]|nr:RecB family exonuclease [Actinomyces sp. oral taxon 180 str. F0310]
MRTRGASVVFMTELIAPSPAERTWDPALSASRAKEYERCPLQYRLHVVDGYREPESRAKALGTLVHAVLEDLFSLPPRSRTRDAARAQLAPAFEALTQKNPEVAALFGDEADREAWLEDARSVVDGYFAIEQPQWIAPAAREARVTATTKGGVRLLGFIDRVDRAPDGRLRVVDYKTGKAPSPRYVDEALFQMRFYALLLARTQVLPSRMQLVYLRAGQVITFDPDPTDVADFERRIDQLWGRIEEDLANDSFQPRKNPLCNWCGVRSLCPVFGGTTPPMPPQHARWLARTRLG